MEERIRRLLPLLDERQKRLFLANEAISYGYGGISLLSRISGMFYMDIPLMAMVQQMAKAINSFSLMAIPFFILAGEIMGAGGISDRMLRFADVCVGHLRGGLAHVNVLASMFFGGISGSAVADVSSLGTIEIPMMVDAGYDLDFSVAVTVTSACQGVLIPPSHNMSSKLSELWRAKVAA